MITFEEIDIKELYYKKTDIILYNFLMVAITDRYMIMGLGTEDKKNFILNNFRINVNYKANCACLWYLGNDRITLKGLIKLSNQKCTISNNWPSLGTQTISFGKELFSYFYEVAGLTFSLVTSDDGNGYYRKIEGRVI